MEHPISQRIKIIMTRESNGKVVDFAKKLNGIPYQVISRLFKIEPKTQKYPTPTTDLILEIIRTFTLYNTSWLLTGDGEMLNENILEKKTENLIPYKASEDEGKTRNLLISEPLATFNNEDYWRGRYDQLKEELERLREDFREIRK